MKNIFKEIFKKRDGVFAVQLFANDKLTLDEFDDGHLILRMPIEGLWKPKPVLFQADPFLFVKKDELFLFYELQYGFAPGQLVMKRTRDLKTWTNPVVVLREPFHLSFPYVFEDKGSVYMIPESEASSSIRLYKANSDLTSFTFVRTLLSQDYVSSLNCNYVDSHIYKKEGVYYLFTSYMKEWKMTQELYFSHDLLNDEFRRHPSSPICISHEYGRNGGSLIVYDGKLLRVSQDCHKDYGDNVSLHEIIKMNESQYEEQLFARNIFSANSLFPDGGHQMNIVKFHERYIYATDYKVNKWTWWHLVHSLCKKCFSKSMNLLHKVK